MQQYRFHNQQSGEVYTHDDPKPTEIRSLLDDISKGARELGNDLCQLESLANRLNDPKASQRQAHLAYLAELLFQNLSAETPTVSDAGSSLVASLNEREVFLKTLARLSVAAEVAAGHLDTSLLARSKPLEHPGLYDLTWRGGEIWQSLTSRKPSINKTVKAGEDRSDFIAFIRRIAGLATGEEPTPDQVTTAFNLRKHKTG